MEANKKNVVIAKPKPSKASLFSPTAEGHVAAADKGCLFFHQQIINKTLLS